MPILKKVEKKVSPPPEVSTPDGYEKYVTFDSNESDELSKLANTQDDVKEPSVKHFSHRTLDGGRYEHTFLKSIIKKVSAFALVVSLIFSGSVYATRTDADLDETLDFTERNVDTDLTEIFARTRGGARTQRVLSTGPAAALDVSTGDLYYITGDTAVTSITAASTWLGRQITLCRLRGTPNTVTLTNGSVGSGNLILYQDIIMGEGDCVTLACLDDENWYQIATADNAIA